MNPFQRARDEAKATREKLAPGNADAAIPAKVLLAAVEGKLNLAIEPVEPTYPDLGQGSAVLQREQRFIYVSKEIPLWNDKFCGLIAHELGHWFLDATKAPTTVAHLKTLFGSEGSPADHFVEANKMVQRSAYPQQFERAFVAISCMRLLQRTTEQWLSRHDCLEQRQARPQLQVVGTAENVVSTFGLDCQDQVNALAERRPQDGMPPIGERLIGGLQPVLNCHCAVAESTPLWENEPHPVTRLAASTQLRDDVGVHRVLGKDESLEVLRGLRHLVRNTLLLNECIAA